MSNQSSVPTPSYYIPSYNIPAIPKRHCSPPPTARASPSTHPPPARASPNTHPPPASASELNGLLAADDDGSVEDGGAEFDRASNAVAVATEGDDQSTVSRSGRSMANSAAGRSMANSAAGCSMANSTAGCSWASSSHVAATIDSPHIASAAPPRNPLPPCPTQTLAMD